MNQCKRIFIIGHPGAGKAIIAMTLAEKLGWRYIDADNRLEFNIGRMLPEIIGAQGEKAFYQCESEILAHLMSKENIVVTTNASIVCDETNRQLLSSEFVVYLKVSTPVQIERTARISESLLPIEDLESFLNKLHRERDSLYEQVASLSIDGDNGSLEEHTLSVIKTVLEANNAKPMTDQLMLDRKDLTIFHKSLHTPVHLSEQQAICLKLLAHGKSSKEIARIINISYRTVEGYIAKMMELLGCSSSKELIALYYDQP